MGQLILFGILIGIVVTAILAISFPEVSTDIINYIDFLFQYIQQGMGIVWLFVPRGITVTLMTLVIGVEVIILGYKFVMWVLRKIPTAGIS